MHTDLLPSCYYNNFVFTVKVSEFPETQKDSPLVTLSLMGTGHGNRQPIC